MMTNTLKFHATTSEQVTWHIAKGSVCMKVAFRVRDVDDPAL